MSASFTAQPKALALPATNESAGAFGWAVNKLARSRRVILKQPVNANTESSAANAGSTLSQAVLVVSVTDSGSGGGILLPVTHATVRKLIRTTGISSTATRPGSSDMEFGRRRRPECRLEKRMHLGHNGERQIPSISRTVLGWLT